MNASQATGSGAPMRRRVAGSSSFLRTEARVRERLLSLLGGAPVAALADAVGLNRESVRRALRGGHISLELVMRVCARYQVRADWLLFGQEPRGCDGAEMGSPAPAPEVGVTLRRRGSPAAGQPGTVGAGLMPGSACPPGEEPHAAPGGAELEARAERS